MTILATFALSSCPTFLSQGSMSIWTIWENSAPQKDSSVHMGRERGLRIFLSYSLSRPMCVTYKTAGKQPLSFDFLSMTHDKTKDKSHAAFWSARTWQKLQQQLWGMVVGRVAVGGPGGIRYHGKHICMVQSIQLKRIFCTGQLFLAVQNSSIGDLVTQVSHSLTVLLLLTYKERPMRPVTFETFDQSDEET